MHKKILVFIYGKTRYAISESNHFLLNIGRREWRIQVETSSIEKKEYPWNKIFHMLGIPVYFLVTQNGQDKKKQDSSLPYYYSVLNDKISFSVLLWFPVMVQYPQSWRSCNSPCNCYCK
jgi:hypothetical protein